MLFKDDKHHLFDFGAELPSFIETNRVMKPLLLFTFLAVTCSLNAQYIGLNGGLANVSAGTSILNHKSINTYLSENELPVINPASLNVGAEGYLIFNNFMMGAEINNIRSASFKSSELNYS